MMRGVRFTILALGLALSACGSKPGTATSENDKVLEDAIALEKKTNDAVNATVAEIERQSAEALNVTAESAGYASNATGN